MPVKSEFYWEFEKLWQQTQEVETNCKVLKFYLIKNTIDIKIDNVLEISGNLTSEFELKVVASEQNMIKPLEVEILNFVPGDYLYIARGKERRTIERQKIEAIQR
jgi:hypothetical protein